MADRVVVYRWADIEQYLQTELEAARSRADSADDVKDLWRAQGEARALRKLLNLPNTLSVLRGE